ncbi:MAG: peptidoglycan-N-acetylglucosamine deacetylase [Mucilaginibacter sp.]|jgi:hypothetical protein|nr:peptidoglycan-N-acetylglucosamine deacetylase [Mucilaginibacter sp.]
MWKSLAARPTLTVGLIIARPARLIRYQLLTFTNVLHPQGSGRRMRFRLLQAFLTYAIDCGDVWIATGGKIARHFEACEAAAT